MQSSRALGCTTTLCMACSPWSTATSPAYRASPTFFRIPTEAEASRSAQHAAAQCYAVLSATAGQSDVNATVQRLINVLQVGAGDQDTAKCRAWHRVWSPSDISVQTSVRKGQPCSSGRPFTSAVFPAVSPHAGPQAGRQHQALCAAVRGRAGAARRRHRLPRPARRADLGAQPGCAAHAAHAVCMVWLTVRLLLWRLLLCCLHCPCAPPHLPSTLKPLSLPSTLLHPFHSTQS